MCIFCISYAEPASSSRPQISGPSDLLRFSVGLGNGVTLMCPAQGFPVPLYRTQVSRCFVPLKHIQLRHLEPVGLARPKFSTIDKSRTFEISDGRGVTLQCPAQAYPVPVFNTKPKLTSLDVKATNPRVYPNASTPLLCPAQGFPVPAFRANGKCEAKILWSFEPVSSAKPKFTNDDIKVVKPTARSSAVALTCPGQGFPVPVTRASAKPKLSANRKIELVESRLSGSSTLMCPVHGYPVNDAEVASPVVRGSLTSAKPKLPANRKVEWLDVHSSGTTKPVGLKPPSFSSDDESRAFSRRKESHVALMCNAQGSPAPMTRTIIVSVPVGLKAPKFSSENSLSAWTKRAGSQITLECNAQGSPAPKARELILISIFDCEPCPEPVGLKAPKFSSDLSFSGYARRKGVDISLQCNAQGSPAPIARYHMRIFTVAGMRSPVGAKSPALSSDDLSRTIGRHEGQDTALIFNHLSSEPVGSKAPAFSGEAKITLLTRGRNEAISISCNAQAHPPPVTREEVEEARSVSDTEIANYPVGSKAPAFLGDVKSFFFLRQEGAELGMTCNAQGHPIPLSSKAPALTGILKGGWMRQNSASHIVLTCPAQGYPVPAFRPLELKHRLSLELSRDGGYRKMKSQALLCQPVGTKAPAFMGEMKGWWFAKVEKSTVVMSCPAQAYPVPAFSKAPAFTGEMKASWWLDKRVKSSLVMPCPAQDPLIVHTKLPGYVLSEPVGSKAPAVIGELRGGWKAKAASTSVVMSCPAQGYPVPNFRKAPSIQGEEGSSMKRRGGMDIVIPCHDPAGRVSPKFPKSAKTNSFEVSNGIETTLLCDAQAFPTPAFRLKLTLFHRSEPVGKVSPKFPRSAKSESFDVITGKELRMLCDAQAYPAPTFRSFFVSFACVYVEPVNGAAPRIPPTAKITVLTSSVTSPVTMLCQAQANPIPIFSGPPRLPPRSKFDALLKPQEMSLTLLCEAQASPPPFYSVFRYYRDNITEPSGSVPPNVRDKEVNGMKRILHVGQTVGLTCPVQGFPAPLFRYT
ncbi:hypothetical protein PV325_001871 [Microctonus aethiopoides]|nr:hypothetical protein PV325_001871 [Microctonus aethiopoides]